MAITVSFAIFSLCPILTIGSPYRLVNITFERIATVSDADYPYHLISLSIILVPALDLLLDYLTLLFSGGEMIKKRARRTAIMRLSDFERLLFLIGVGLQSVVIFVKHPTDDHTLNVIVHSICNSTTLLLLAPILSFLRRCTSSFSPMRSQVTFSFAIAGLLCRTIGLFSRAYISVYEVMVMVGGACLVFAISLYVLCSMLCLYNYLIEKLGTPADRQIVREWLLRKHNKKEQNVDENIETATDKDSEFYINYVPACHILSSLIIVFAITIRGCNLDFELYALTSGMNYLIISAEILVLIVELRIRKNEINRGLVRSLVRYILP